jgi:hypothetical protein
MNRHAAICQLQRLIKSFVFVFKRVAVNLELKDIDMEHETRLSTDISTFGVIQDRPPTRTATYTKKEHWLFVNGIGGEVQYLRLACRKLAARYLRPITGIFNRGDGLFWDLGECAGERIERKNGGSTSSQANFCRRTKSSMEAEELLTKELKCQLNWATAKAVAS